jgi:hypothetical protein
VRRKKKPQKINFRSHYPFYRLFQFSFRRSIIAQFLKKLLFTRIAICATLPPLFTPLIYLHTVMDTFLRKLSGNCPVAWKAGLAAVVCLGLTGCARIHDLRGEGFHDNSMGQIIKESQPEQKKPKEFWSFSNKARDIESDFPDH